MSIYIHLCYMFHNQFHPQGGLFHQGGLFFIFKIEFHQSSSLNCMAHNLCDNFHPCKILNRMQFIIRIQMIISMMWSNDFIHLWTIEFFCVLNFIHEQCFCALLVLYSNVGGSCIWRFCFIHPIKFCLFPKISIFLRLLAIHFFFFLFSLSTSFPFPLPPQNHFPLFLFYFSCRSRLFV